MRKVELYDQVNDGIAIELIDGGHDAVLSPVWMRADVAQDRAGELEEEPSTRCEPTSDAGGRRWNRNGPRLIGEATPLPPEMCEE